jgi:hypothetical protein
MTWPMGIKNIYPHETAKSPFLQLRDIVIHQFTHGQA